ncbi:putative lipopolysaccharide heptosyltransferase III [Nitrosophilus kaiyonis]|uniref:putative lipopolysaccharide heptosyltransferase III n=1 Tax=Nitrosophilus kaiyonis TaxID=2930200 RepID=UPI00248F9AC5|nr:putative lipopolysaccharide heptosyltransferase III [Nitrosophilus kaiyonis]
MKILIIKFRNIGDVLLTTPLLKNLKLHFPKASIDFALNEGTEDMISLNPNINIIHIYKREKLKNLNFLKRVYEEIKFANNIRKEKYDIVINTTRGDRGLLLAIFSGAKKIIGYPSRKNKILNRFINYKLPNLGFRHMVETHFDILKAFDKEPLEKRVEIFWSKKDEDKIKQILNDFNINEKKFVHIHPVSRWLFKCIDDQIMAKIIDYCENELGYKVVLTAAPIQKELKKIENILNYCKSNPINLSGKLSLKQTAALNKKAKIFIGVDTAIMHISAANDIPVLSFFGPSAAFHWGPWDNNLMESKYIKTKGNQSMGKHRVLQKDWDCVPCGKDGCNGSKISDCLIQMNLEEIKQNIKEMIK